MNERTILAAEKNLIKNNKLTMENVGALIDAYIYDTSASIGASRTFLKKMKEVVNSGKPVECNIRGQVCVIKTEAEFYEFVNQIFTDINMDV
ncbi:MAG: hypothetical protein MJ104_07120 [Lachnospiraceae bacterium]|nr:hypothetical protein [Lachnospiraceae bacterium]